MRRAEDERRTGRNQHNDFHQVTHCASRWASSCPVQRSRLFFLSTRRSTRKRRHLNVATAAAAFRLPLGTAGSGAAKGKCAALSRWRFDDEAVAASSATAPAAHQLSRILQSRNRSCNYSEIHLARQKSLRRTRHNPRLSLRRRPTKKRRNEIKIKLRRRNNKKKKKGLVIDIRPRTRQITTVVRRLGFLSLLQSINLTHIRVLAKHLRRHNSGRGE